VAPVPNYCPPLTELTRLPVEKTDHFYLFSTCQYRQV